MMKNSIRIGCGQGFWGDWIEAPVKLANSGSLDYLMLDYLAEVTMSILAKQYERDNSKGYASDFPPLVEKLYQNITDNGLKIIANAGGVNPEACKDAVLSVLEKIKKPKDPTLKIAVVSGDNLLPSLENLKKVGELFSNLEDGSALNTIEPNLKSMNAYLGAKPIVDALREGANIIITGRVSDPAMALAPMIYEFNWSHDQYDKLAQGVVAGHIIECGAQATGGNFSLNWQGLNDFSNIGYPIVEVFSDSNFMVTKPDGSGGEVSKATVTEQLVYEIGDPKTFITPDVIADFTSITLTDKGNNQVLISGTKGFEPTKNYKVSCSYLDGYMAEGTLILVGPEVRKKAQICESIIRDRILELNLEYSEILFESLGDYSSTPGLKNKISHPEPMEVVFRVAIKGTNKKHLERFTREIAPLVLSGPSGITGYAGGKKPVREIFSYFPTLVRKDLINVQYKIYQ